MTAPTTAPRNWTTAEVLAEATDDIDTIEDAWSDLSPAIIALTAAVMDIDHDGLDYTAVRAERFTH